jgi:hypothetical protein
MSNKTATLAIAAIPTCHYRHGVAQSKKVDPRVTLFMREVMEHLEVTRPAELIDILVREGIVKASQTRKVSRWLSGENGPDFATTMALMDLAGLYRPGHSNSKAA